MNHKPAHGISRVNAYLFLHNTAPYSKKYKMKAAHYVSDLTEKDLYYVHFDKNNGTHIRYISSFIISFYFMETYSNKASK